MFEMLCGYPPFYADDPIQTCHKIVRWKEFLQFPDKDEINLSPESLDLMKRFLTDADKRIGSNGIEEIKRHPFFRGIDWENIRSQPAMFKPDIKNEIDTSYFDEFDETTSEPRSQRYNPLQDENLVFKGYTYNRRDDKMLHAAGLKVDSTEKGKKKSVFDVFGTQQSPENNNNNQHQQQQ
eukprot:GEZU01032945.1.p2 GENE.GEZU01032945.1~~GEZU01032945.1.p2  ORF type:complete len:180 (-),score=81.62 GEZU01032945.1:323-862(-)